MENGVSSLRPTTFDPAAYWRERLVSLPSLAATGTRPFGLEYQPYLYRLKEAALRRALRGERRMLSGASVLNVGCGWGYFEPVFASWGARQVMGVDFVPESVASLRESRPEFEYAWADISQQISGELANRQFDVVSAIDMLYHIVDDAAFDQAVQNLCTLCRPNGGLLIWTDAPNRSHDPNHPHCRYRPWSAYERIFAAYGVRMLRATPMYCLFDHYWRWSELAARYSGWTYPAMYAIDRVVAPFGLRRSANWCAIAIRTDTTSGTKGDA